MGIRVCFFGDSFVNGTGDDGCLGWAGRLCSAERGGGADVTLYNLGVRRDTSTDVRRRWKAEAEARLPDAGGRLVFSFGLNDLAPRDDQGIPRVPRETTLSNARSILREASSWLPTLMIGPLPVTHSVERNNEVTTLSDCLQTICEEIDVPFFSAVPFAKTIFETWRCEADNGDGIHPNGRSYAALAAALGHWQAWRKWFSDY